MILAPNTVGSLGDALNQIGQQSSSTSSIDGSFFFLFSSKLIDVKFGLIFLTNILIQKSNGKKLNWESAVAILALVNSIIHSILWSTTSTFRIHLT